jgi:ABC-type polysaccharide/polyol phosphate transport system ATPase subunit
MDDRLETQAASESAADPAAAAASQARAATEHGLAISVENASKCYKLYRKPSHRLWDQLRLGGPRYREFWALRQAYLEIRKGTTVGIIGENGAGKSTLLKLIGGITAPSTGSVQVQGRLTSLIELGAGFHPEFSGRENIGLACSILGIGRDEAQALTPQIIEFSELGEFIDRPVKSYSSGMYVRLGFAVATCVHPDILLVDEALAVGDEHFRAKCMRRLNEFSEAGGTTVFVSHDLGAVRSMCQQVVLLHQGRIVEQGDADRVADAYLKRVKARGDEALSFAAREASEYPRWGSGEVLVERVELLGGDGQPTRVLTPGEHTTVRLHYRVHGESRRPVFGLGLYRSDGTYVNGSNHDWRQAPLLLERPPVGETGEVDMALSRLPLLSGEYYLSTFVYDHGVPAPQAIDHAERALSFRVADANPTQHGLMRMESAWAVRRSLPDGTEDRQESPQ